MAFLQDVTNLEPNVRENLADQFVSSAKDGWKSSVRIGDRNSYYDAEGFVYFSADNVKADRIEKWFLGLEKRGLEVRHTNWVGGVDLTLDDDYALLLLETVEIRLPNQADLEVSILDRLQFTWHPDTSPSGFKRHAADLLSDFGLQVSPSTIPDPSSYCGEVFQG